MWTPNHLVFVGEERNYSIFSLSSNSWIVISKRRRNQPIAIMNEVLNGSWERILEMIWNWHQFDCRISEPFIIPEINIFTITNLPRSVIQNKLEERSNTKPNGRRYICHGGVLVSQRSCSNEFSPGRIRGQCLSSKLQHSNIFIEQIDLIRWPPSKVEEQTLA